ncbi:MAG: SDR family NAD(P)-dependent oxidoreductase [Proteobacteria bacterium]|nr:SDR family NAD(P)-dependent oxidoreductase [Pseudomonadota bacterium]
MAFAPFDLTGKVALITGGNSGIGLGMAEGIAQAGGDVCIWGTNTAKNAAAVERLAGHGTKVSALRCDVSDADAVAAAFSATLDTHGRIDGCFANAGIGGRGVPFEQMPFDDWRRVMAVNLDGAYHTFRHAAGHMRQRSEAGNPGGRLIATASLAAISGQARGEHYAATKGALVSMIKALAVEYARHGVTAHTILPGWIETAMTAGSFGNDKFVDNVMKRIPMRRWGAPEDFAAIAVYIMSDASAYHTADTFLIDGGYHSF